MLLSIKEQEEEGAAKETEKEEGLPGACNHKKIEVRVLQRKSYFSGMVGT